MNSTRSVTAAASASVRKASSWEPEPIMVIDTSLATAARAKARMAISAPFRALERADEADPDGT